MKEATGEGSMTIVTIVVIVGLIAAAVFIIAAVSRKANSSAESASSGYNANDPTQSRINELMDED